MHAFIFVSLALAVVHMLCTLWCLGTNVIPRRTTATMAIDIALVAVYAGWGLWLLAQEAH